MRINGCYCICSKDTRSCRHGAYAVCSPSSSAALLLYIVTIWFVTCAKWGQSGPSWLCLSLRSFLSLLCLQSTADGNSNTDPNFKATPSVLFPGLSARENDASLSGLFTQKPPRSPSTSPHSHVHEHEDIPNPITVPYEPTKIVSLDHESCNLGFDATFTSKDFPRDFGFGSATAAFQAWIYEGETVYRMNHWFVIELDFSFMAGWRSYLWRWKRTKHLGCVQWDPRSVHWFYALEKALWMLNFLWQGRLQMVTKRQSLITHTTSTL